VVDVVGCKMCVHVLILIEFNIEAELNEVGKKKHFTLHSYATETEILMTCNHFKGILLLSSFIGITTHCGF
jgi:hypothetical protein